MNLSWPSISINKFENRFYRIENYIKTKKATFEDFSKNDLNKLWKKIKLIAKFNYQIIIN